MRYLTAALAVLVLAGCDSTAPHPFPELRGTWSYEAHHEADHDLRLVGTLALDATHQSGAVTGSFDIRRIEHGTEVARLQRGYLHEGAVNTEGRVFLAKRLMFRSFGEARGDTITAQLYAILPGDPGEWRGPVRMVRQ